MCVRGGVRQVPAWDFLTMIMTVDLAPGETETLLRQYHEHLVQASAAAQASYSFDMLLLDFRIGVADGSHPISSHAARSLRARCGL